MKKNTGFINDAAIKALKEGNLYVAQQLFRENIKNERCVMTLNNLGVFYSEFNILSENLRERDGRKLALHYLTQAVDNDQSGKTAFSMGNVFFKLEMYVEAALCFNRSFLFNHQFSSVYNMGLCHFQEREYEQSLFCFELAAPLAKETEQVDIMLAIAYAEAYCQKSSVSKSAERVFCLNDNFFVYDKFVLSYLIGDEKRMKEYVIPTVKNFSLDQITRAMVIDTLLLLNRKNDADVFYRQELEHLKDSPYNNSKEIAQLKRVVEDAVYRKAMIRDYMPPLTLANLDCYIIDYE